MNSKMLLSMILIVLATMITLVTGYNYDYIQNIDPHTRYNNMLNDCFYFYGYGSCNVTKTQCDGVAIGQNKWVDLGDACHRNEPPKMIIKAADITATETELVKINAAVECNDQDPVKLTYSGWSDAAEKQTGYEDAGSYAETITCTDSFGEKISVTINININNKNRAPVFRAMDFELNPK